MHAKDLVGYKTGQLTVIRLVGSWKKKRHWDVECACGVHKTMVGSDITGGRVVSCGCFKDKLIAQRNRDNALHGKTGCPTYISWFNMRQRCLYKKDKNYHLYGGRGVTVCDRWSDFRNFLADMGERPNGKTIDRIDPYGNYEPSNCRWATVKEQAANKRVRNVHSM